MIRVLIERRLAAGQREALQRAMRELRLEAIHRDGYIGGETYIDGADPNHYLTLSTWRSRDAWESWAASEPRRAAEALIAPMLAVPETVTVLEPV
ncbi:MAG: antibiotic biosynthesis monooxygenase [Candidatus Binatia bacterium]